MDAAGDRGRVNPEISRVGKGNKLRPRHRAGAFFHAVYFSSIQPAVIRLSVEAKNIAWLTAARTWSSE